MLCQNCAKLVDNDESLFPTSALKAWKTLREHSATTSIGQTRQRSVETESQKKFREISKWKSKQVLLVKMANPQQTMSLGIRPWAPIDATVVDWTEFYVLVKGSGWDKSRSIPLGNIEIGYDDKFNRIELLEYDR